MSGPVRSVQGEETTRGFRVRLLGAESLDGASSIARAHPLVERASVENEGTEAVLRIRFVAGAQHSYRVEAIGTRVEISVSRSKATPR